MPAGHLSINGVDAFTNYGVSLESSGLSSLLTPSPIKDLVSSSSRLNDGRVYDTTNVKQEMRSLTITFNMIAKNDSSFFSQYSSLMSVLAAGKFTLTTKYQSGVVYRLIYQSCTQFTEFRRGIAKFQLRVIEPDPTNRGANDKTETT